MNNFQKMITNRYLYIPLILWFCIQTFKVIYELIKTKKFNFKRIVGAGGMPSSHSAIAMCIATMIETPGLTNVQVQEKLVEVLGHTPIQVFVGAFLGIIVGLFA